MRATSEVEVIVLCVRIVMVSGLALAPFGAASADDADWQTGQTTDPGEATTATAARRTEPIFLSPRATGLVTAARLRERGISTAVEALEESAGVYVQRTSSVGGTPVVRGLFGQRVLLLIDGVRLNNAITGFDPLQLLSTVDPFQLARIEIVRGPAAALYGSDATGGVINLISQTPDYDPFRAWDARGSALLRFESASMAAIGHVAAEGHLKQLGARVAATLRRFGDLSSGSGGDEQRFTGAWEGNAHTTLAWRSDSHGSVSLRYSGARLRDGYYADRSTPADFVRAREQFRDVIILDYHGPDAREWLSSLRATLSYQRQHELRERVRPGQEHIEQEIDDAHTLGASLSASTSLPYNDLHYGMDLYLDLIDSAARDATIDNAQSTAAGRGRYVDGSRYSQLGAWITDRIAFGGRFAVDLGGRVAAWFADIAADESNDAPAVDSAAATFLGSAHARYLLGNGLNLLAGVSQGYRAPNIDDYSALGCNGQVFDTPSSNLRAEKSVSAEGGIKLDLFGVIRGSLFYALTWLDDMIVRRPLAGSPQRLCGQAEDGTPLAVDQTRRENAEYGLVHAVEAQLDVTLARQWEVFAWLAWTRGTVRLGDDTAGSEPLDRIPPLNGLAGLRYRGAHQRWFGELVLRWAARQDRLSPTDTNDRRICTDGPSGCRGTAGFASVGLRGGVRLWWQPLRLLLALDNVAHQAHRWHGAAVDATGINARVSLELDLP